MARLGSRPEGGLRAARGHAENDFALRWAAFKGHTETVKLLLDRGANIHSLDDLTLHNAGQNALGPPSGRPQAALRPGAKTSQDEPRRAKTHTETMKLLLDRGADIHGRNDSVLRSAVLNGHPETVRLLLMRGPRAGSQAATIEPDIRRLAEQIGNPEIIALLG